MERISTTAGEKINPAAGTMLAQTQPLIEGLWHFQLLINTQGASKFTFYHFRPDLLSIHVGQHFYLGSNDGIDITLLLSVGLGDVVSLYATDAVTGKCHGAIIGLKIR